jgi:tRNA modification GTPase
MTKSTPFDTIAAISTPPGEGGIGIVKISGEKSFEIVKKIFHPQRKKNLSPEMKSFSMLLGYIKGENGIIDEVLVSRMKSPHTYTRENIVEINCHGGAAPLNEVLRTVLSSGARLAEPGEFTKRAFINGRIDLSQAEAVLDIIRSKTNRALDAAVRQLRGEISEKIQSMVDSLKNVLVVLEANIDFPEEEDVSHVQFMKIM